MLMLYTILYYCRLPNDEVEASIINKILHCRQAAIEEKEKEIECTIEEKKAIDEEKDKIKKENERISEQNKALKFSYDTALQQLSC